MSDEPDKRLDERVHAYLDGDLSPSDAAAFEGEIEADSLLGNRVAALRGMAAWSRASRPEAPPSLVPAVARATEAEAAPRAGTAISSPLPLVRRPRFFLPVGLAAAAVLAILLVPRILPERAGPTAERIPVTEPGNPLGASDSGDDRVVCEFQFRAPDAREVCLAGDFNQWTVCETRLTRVGEDLWTVSMELPRGRHEYMFVVDGRWVTDPDAVTTTDDGFGNRNAVLSL